MRGEALRPGRDRAAGLAFGGRRVVWVDALEIDCINGCMTMRAGSPRETPLLVVLPAHYAEDLPDIAAEASLDAEEDYWDVMSRLVSLAPEPGTAGTVLGDWVLDQDWWSDLSGLVESDNDMFFVVKFGFVGMILGPPFTPVPAFAVFDPMQLRRLDGVIRKAISDGMGASRPVWSTAVLDATLRALRERSWGDLRWDDLTREQAEAEMRQRKAEFLSRTPRLRVD